MFGLPTPLVQCEQAYEFDSVSTILSHSSVAKSSRQKRAPPWLGSVQPDGGVFHLELPPGIETKLARLSSSDGGSVSSLALGVGGCNSEDTGYSSDQESPASSTDKSSSDNVFKPSKRSKLRSRHEEFHDLSKTSDSGLLPLNRKSFSSLSSSASSSTIQEAEAQFDQLSLSSSGRGSGKHRFSSTPNNFCADSVFKSSLDEDNDDGICLNKSDLRSSKTSSLSAVSCRSSFSVLSSDSRGGSSSHRKSNDNSFSSNSSRSSKAYLTNNHRIKSKELNSSRSSFSQRFKNPLQWKTFHIDIKIATQQPPTSTKTTTSASLPLESRRQDRVELCRNLLGILPTWPEDVDPSHRGHTDIEVMVKSVVPGSPLSFSTQDLQGAWLHRVNGQALTWDNMDAVLASLGRLRKAKLTFKSPRSDNSAVDLEALVNILTTDVQDEDCLDNMAAMYISLDGVDPDDPSSSANDGLVYSFPRQRTALCQLQGLFYTLAHLVKDMSLRGTIRNTTIVVDKRTTHIAYLQEGSDILVFAVPASYLSVPQLNALLTEFSRLLRLLFVSVEAAFTGAGNHSRNGHTTGGTGSNLTFIDTILSYLFRQVVSASASLAPSNSSLLSSSLSSTGFDDKGEHSVHAESQPFVRFSQHIPALVLPTDILMIVDKTMSEFECSDFADMSEAHYGCRRQFTVLGSAFFYCGQLIASHLAREDLRDLHLYAQSVGILDLSGRCSLAQLVAWREIHPTRQCHDVAEINNSFGYSEPNARWCLLIVGLKHGLFCCLLESVGPGPLRKAALSPDVFYVEQAKACLLQLQTPQLMAAFNIRISKESQSAVAKSDYCATYVHTNGEKSKAQRLNQQTLPPTHSNWSGGLRGSDSISVCSSDNPYRSPRSGKMYPVPTDVDSISKVSLSLSSSEMMSFPSLHRLSSTRYPAIYQYCCLDGMEGTIITGSDMDTSASIFHDTVLRNYYRHCRDIHNFFLSHGDSSVSKLHYKDEDDVGYDDVLFDPHLRGMKEHGVLMTVNPHQEESGSRKSQQVLEYWVIGRRIKRPNVREAFVCVHASASQSMVELAFRLGFGSLS